MPHTNWKERTETWRQRQGDVPDQRPQKSSSLRNRMRSIRRLLSRPVRARAMARCRLRLL